MITKGQATNDGISFESDNYKVFVNEHEEINIEKIRTDDEKDNNTVADKDFKNKIKKYDYLIVQYLKTLPLLKYLLEFKIIDITINGKESLLTFLVHLELLLLL